MKISRFAAALIVTVAGSNEGAAQWTLGATRPDKAGQRTFLATLYAVGDGRDSTRLERLFVRCHQNRVEVVALLGWPIAVDDSGLTEVRVAWNDEPAEPQLWDVATSGDAIFALDAVRMVEDRIVSARRLTLDVRPRADDALIENSPGRRVTFEPAGFEPLLRTFRDACPDDPWLGTPARAELDGQEQAYFEFQVDKQVAMVGRPLPPAYPEELREQGLIGEVLVQFVVRPNGWVDRKTIKVIRSTHPLFTNAVREALLAIRYRPAEIGGRKVSQLVQQPFNFRLTH